MGNECQTNAQKNKVLAELTVITIAAKELSNRNITGSNSLLLCIFNSDLIKQVFSGNVLIKSLKLVVIVQ